MNPIIYYGLQFFLGGGIIVGMSFLAKHVNPKAASLLYILPIQFTIAAIFIYLGSSKQTIQQLASSTIFSVLLLVAFIGLFYILIHRMEFWPSLVISYVVFISLGAIYLYCMH